MKYKVGDKVLIVKLTKDSIEVQKYVGTIGTVESFNENRSDVFNVDLLCFDKQQWSFNEKELILATKTAKILYGENNG